MKSQNPFSQAELERQTQATPTDADAWEALAFKYYETGRWQQALQAFERWQELGAAGQDFHFFLGICQLRLGKDELAEKALEKASSAGHQGAQHHLGLLYARRARRIPKMKAKAQACFEQVLLDCDQGKTYRAEDQVCFALGDLLGSSEEQLEQAIKIYRRGIASNPLSPRGHSGLGDLLMKKGQLLGAVGEYKVSIQLDPGYNPAYSKLAQLFFDHVKAADLAQEFSHIQEEFGERSPEVLAQLALEVVEQGRNQVYRGIYTKGHQLKNLMGIMGSKMRRFARQNLSADENQKAINLLVGEQQHLYEEWVGFLGAMRLEQIRPVLLEPGQLATRVIEALKSQGTQTLFGLRIQDGVPPIEADEGLLREALTNLCLNAQEAVREKGGKIILGVGFDEDISMVFLEVEDEGPGIAHERIDYIFEPGYTTKDMGNGYGLSIARRIAQAHHGQWRVKSQVGHSTVFRLDLPVSYEADGQEKSLGGNSW